MKAKEHINLLGLIAEDTVTGFGGVVTSVSFDLYGCIQVAITPGLDEKGRIQDGHWFDANRLKIKSRKPVMKIPDFESGPQAEGLQGPAEKPTFTKP